MNDEQPSEELPFQTVSLDDERTLVLFVQGSDGNTRVFYDVGFVASHLAVGLAQKVLAMDPSTLTESERGYVLGQTDLIEHIGNQGEGFRQTYDFTKMLESISDPGDISGLFD